MPRSRENTQGILEVGFFFELKNRHIIQRSPWPLSRISPPPQNQRERRGGRRRDIPPETSRGGAGTMGWSCCSPVRGAGQAQAAEHPAPARELRAVGGGAERPGQAPGSSGGLSLQPPAAPATAQPSPARPLREGDPGDRRGAEWRQGSSSPTPPWRTQRPVGSRPRPGQAE